MEVRPLTFSTSKDLPVKYQTLPRPASRSPGPRVELDIPRVLDARGCTACVYMG